MSGPEVVVGLACTMSDRGSLAESRCQSLRAVEWPAPDASVVKSSQTSLAALTWPGTCW
jgi:hypothetical protein